MDYTYNGIKYFDTYVGMVCADSYKEAGEIVKQKIKDEISPSVTDIWIILTDINEANNVSFRSYGDKNYDES